MSLSFNRGVVQPGVTYQQPASTFGSFAQPATFGSFAQPTPFGSLAQPTTFAQPTTTFAQSPYVQQPFGQQSYVQQPAQIGGSIRTVGGVSSYPQLSPLATQPFGQQMLSQPRVISGGTIGGTYAGGSLIGGQTMMGGQTVMGGVRTIQGGYSTVAQPRYQMGQYAARSYAKTRDAQNYNLNNCRKQCGLGSVPVRNALTAFATAARASDSRLDRNQFAQIYASVLQEHDIQPPSQPVAAAVFQLVDRDNNGIVDLMELACGLSLLCAGTEDEKISAVFDTFDSNGDGLISKEEMSLFLTSVFRVVLSRQVMEDMKKQNVEVSGPEELAEVTTDECFASADLNHDGSLTIEEFRKWFNAPTSDTEKVFAPTQSLWA